MEPAANLVSKWQPILRLKDWDIRIKIVTSPWRKSGDIKIDADNKMAVLMLNEKPYSTNLEEVVVHELIHLKLWDLDQMIEELINVLFGEDEANPRRAFVYTQFMKLIEVTTEDLTKGFLAVAGCKEPLSFGRIEREVMKELEKGQT